MKSKYPPGTDCNSMQNDIDALEEELQACKDVMFEASLLVTQAMADVRRIADGEPMHYADEDSLKALDRPRWARRAMTMKDAKPIASRSVEALYKAWNMLDPR